MPTPETRRRDAILVTLYVLGTLLLLLFTQRREQRETLRWSERREGELRDALTHAAAPDGGDGPVFGGFTDEDFDRDPWPGPRGREEPLWSTESPDGFRAAGAAGRWGRSLARTCR